MGIKGLFQLLEGIQKHTHLRTFAGQTLGIDAYGWLHRGTFACAPDLAQGKPTRAHINFAMNRIRMLLHFGVTPYVVFDGDYLPSKAHTERDRAQRRREARRQGLSLLQAGKIQQATQELRKSVDVTPTMARDFIEELKLAGISYVVAPFEADSQLAYLEKKGLINGIISEDSDLLVFGASRLITKLDQYGDCVMVRRQDFTLCREVSLINWSDKDFRMMAMLSGCDYLPGIDKLGLKTAYRLVRKYKTIEAIVRNLQFDGKLKVPVGFLEDFYQADRTFLHQWVFCPEARCMVNLNSLPSGLTLDDMSYIGKYVEPELAQGVANGDLDPNSKNPLHPSRYIPPRRATMPAPATPDLKGKKPISDYFRPQRTPLAELDPNSFTPSPSQQRLLSTQQNRSWSASYTSNRSTSAGVRRASLQASTQRQTPKTQLSPRRKRFCADVLADLQGDTDTVSHYFSPSASIKKTAKSSKTEFELYSDDSIAEAICASVTAVEEVVSLSQAASNQTAQVTNQEQDNHAASDIEPARPPLLRASTSPKKRKRLAVYHDDVVQANSASQSQASSFSATTSLFVDSQDVVAQSDPVSDLEKLTAPWKYEAPSSVAEPLILDTPACKQVALEDTHAVTMTIGGPSILYEAQGSEDLLIPQSPSSNEDDGRLRPKLSLDQYLFAS